MRLFVAVYPGAAAIKTWEQFQKTAPGWPLRWVPRESLHLTLKFLGEISPELETKIEERLSRVAPMASSFSLELRGGGVFPPKGPPSIFWTGIGGEAPLLIELAKWAELELKTIGFPPEKRPYHPHMTVARPANSQERPHPKIAQEFISWATPFSTDPFQVTQLCLVESRLGSVGSTYIVRRTFELR